MPKTSLGPCVGVSMESLVQDHNQPWVLVLGCLHSLGRDKKRKVCPIKVGKTKSTESTSIIAESESYKRASGESYI